MVEAVKCQLLPESNSSCTNYAHSFENPAGISLHFHVFKIRHFIWINGRKKNFKNQTHIRQPHSSLRTRGRSSGWYLSAGVFIHCRTIPCKMPSRSKCCALLCWYSCAAPNGGAALLASAENPLQRSLMLDLPYEASSVQIFTQCHNLGVLWSDRDYFIERFSVFTAIHGNSCGLLNLANHLDLLQLKKSESSRFIKRSFNTET